MIATRISHSIQILDDIILIRQTKDEKFFVIASEKELVIVTIETRERRAIEPAVVPRLMELILNDTCVIVGINGTPKLYIYEIPSLEFKRSIDSETSTFSKIAVSNDGLAMVSMMKDKKALFWELENPKNCNEISAKPYTVAAISYDKSYALLGMAHKVSMFALSRKSKLLCENDVGSNVARAQFAPSGEVVVVAAAQSVRIKSISNLADLMVIPLENQIYTMSISTKDDILLLGLKDGSVAFYDHKNEKDPIFIKIHKSAVTNIILNHNNSTIYTTETDQKRNFGKTQFPQMIMCKKLKCNQILGFSPQSKLFLKYRDGVKLLNLKTNTEEQISKLDGISNVLFAGNDKVIVCHLSVIMVINLQTQTSNTMTDSDMDAPTSLVADQDGNFLYTGYKNKIKVWDLQEMALKSEWLGHEDFVTSLLLVNKKVDQPTDSALLQIDSSVPQETTSMLISASYDNTIKVWNPVTSELVSIFRGHTGNVDNLEISKENNLLISAGADKTIRIWNWELSILVCTLEASADITGLHLTQDSAYLISSSADGKIIFWSMKSFSRVFYNQVPDKIVKLYVSPDDSYIGYILASGACYVADNPLASKEIIVTGPSQKYYQYLLYLKSIIGYTDIPEHNIEFDDWVVLPYFLTAPHFYAKSDLRKHLRKSLASEFRITETSFGSNVLSIATEMDYRECRNVIIKSMIRNYKENPFSLASINKEVFVDLNNEGFRFFLRLYDLIFRRCQGYGLPTRCSEDLQLPVFYHSNEIVPYANNFIPDVAKDSQKQIFFMHSLIPFNLTTGSQDSLDFIKSTLDSPNSDIFRTKFIQSLYRDKWNLLKWYMYTQGLLYMVYMISLQGFLVFFQDLIVFLVVPVVFSLILTSYEVYQAVSAPGYYFEDPWNYLDIARATLMMIYAIMCWSGANDEATVTALLLLQLTSWLRGITYFRLFPPTRYMINLLTEVVVDMISFLILLFYSTFAFSFIMLILDPPDNRGSLVSYVVNSYLLNLGEFDASGLSVSKAIVFFIVSIINPVVMMNLLISVIGDTYDRVQENLEVADYIELAGMILEVETLLFWKRGIKDETYLQMCLEETLGTGQTWTGSVRELKVLIRMIKEGQIKTSLVKIEENKNLKEHAKRFEKTVAEETQAMKDMLDELKKEQMEIATKLDLNLS